MHHAEFGTHDLADAFVAEHHPGAAPMPALTVLLGNPVLLDRDTATVVRLHDWSDEAEDPGVNVDLIAARDFVYDQDLVDQAGMLLDEGRADPVQVRAVLSDLTAIGSAAVAPDQQGDPLPGVVTNAAGRLDHLESAAAIVRAVRDRAARQHWTQRAAAGTAVDKAAAELDVEPDALAAMILADRARVRDL